MAARKAATKTVTKAAKALRSATNKKAPSPSEDTLAGIMERLLLAVPEPRCELAFANPFQLLIATILSAQSTDKTVNAVTPVLFARYPTPQALAAALQEDVEELVKRTGFFRNKAKAIRGAAQKLVDEFGGEPPRTIEQLITLPGVARKTANVLLGTAFGINAGFVVDTHIARVSQRLGLTGESDAGKIERDLCRQVPQASWSDTGHRILLHGRYTCLAKAPMCSVCPLNELCPSKLVAPDEPAWEVRAESEAARVTAGMAVTAPDPAS